MEFSTSSPFSSPKRRCLDGQKIKTSDVDSGRCAHLENLRQKEDTSVKHCSITWQVNLEGEAANRRDVPDLLNIYIRNAIRI